eukprot:TRINITY_DN16231_c0_g1_i1.p2 TRINITY_DN16231_c0_g1~~TRINITY_DN16231_c0_g1_i1.p2  ORF type:complete len:119 (+),score=32.85 TRINITY_DN16231_c0_g1_i1:523-879(+)
MLHDRRYSHFSLQDSRVQRFSRVMACVLLERHLSWLCWWRIVTGMNGDAEYKQALKEKWSDDFADRRQELVFIGQRMKEAEIRFLLDECLLTDEEMEDYKEAQEKDMEMARKTVDMPF